MMRETFQTKQKKCLKFYKIINVICFKISANITKEETNLYLKQ